MKYHCIYKHKAIICQLEYFQRRFQVIFGNIKAYTRIFYTIRSIFYIYQQRKLRWYFIYGHRSLGSIWRWDVTRNFFKWPCVGYMPDRACVLKLVISEVVMELIVMANLLGLESFMSVCTAIIKNTNKISTAISALRMSQYMVLLDLPRYYICNFIAWIRCWIENVSVESSHLCGSGRIFATNQILYRLCSTK